MGASVSVNSSPERARERFLLKHYNLYGTINLKSQLCKAFSAYDEGDQRISVQKAAEVLSSLKIEVDAAHLSAIWMNWLEYTEGDKLLYFPDFIQFLVTGKLPPIPDRLETIDQIEKEKQKVNLLEQQVQAHLRQIEMLEKRVQAGTAILEKPGRHLACSDSGEQKLSNQRNAGEAKKIEHCMKQLKNLEAIQEKKETLEKEEIQLFHKLLSMAHSVLLGSTEKEEKYALKARETDLEATVKNQGKTECRIFKPESEVWAAAKNGNIEVIQKYAQNSFDFSSLDNFGNSPLYLACLCGHIEVCDLILKQLGGPSSPVISKSEKDRCITNALNKDIKDLLTGKKSVEEIVKTRALQSSRRESEEVIAPFFGVLEEEY